MEDDPRTNVQRICQLAEKLVHYPSHAFTTCEDKIKALSFRGAQRAEESLFSLG
jgi:hypothetical protein